MKNRRAVFSRKRLFPVFVGCLVLGVFGAGLYLVQSERLVANKTVCAACQRPLHPGQTFIVVSDSKEERLTCCPRCGLRSAVEDKAEPTQATDFSSGRRIDAGSAYYLEGSDIMQCCQGTTLRTDGGSICELHFDRCLPSLLAFVRVEDAEAYQREHGGQVISFATARQSVLEQMGQSSSSQSK
jgi:hypothetical protein